MTAGDAKNALGESEASLPVDVEDLAHGADVGSRTKVKSKVILLGGLNNLLQEFTTRTINMLFHKKSAEGTIKQIVTTTCQSHDFKFDSFQGQY